MTVNTDVSDTSQLEMQSARHNEQMRDQSGQSDSIVLLETVHSSVQSKKLPDPIPVRSSDTSLSEFDEVGIFRTCSISLSNFLQPKN